VTPVVTEPRHEATVGAASKPGNAEKVVLH
jgi:hypothetical protein